MRKAQGALLIFICLVILMSMCAQVARVRSSDSDDVIVSVEALKFGKAEVGQHNATSRKDYKMTTRYLMPDDGWITSVLMWFGDQGFDAKVAIYAHPEGKLITQSQSEPITSTGWHNFTIQRTFLFSGLYGLSWKTSQDAITAYDSGLSDQSARTPEPYSYSFSSTFGPLEFFSVETSIYATYDPVAAKVGVLSYAQTPSYDESVTVSAYARDGGILSEPVVLNYSTSANDRIWTSVSMMPEGGLFTAQIQSHRYDTIVYYKVYAQNARGEPICSEMLSYKVGDFQSPVVSYLDRTPGLPNYNETVIISADVYEPLDASGIELVSLFYWNGSQWTNMNMTLQNGLYTAEIPPMLLGTSVNYTVVAFDYAQNVATVDIYSYSVTDRFPPTAKIDGLTQTDLRGVVPLIVTGVDDNFDRMELYVSGQLVQSWYQSSTATYYWDTSKYRDGTYSVKLIVYDKANNTSEKELSANVVNAVPASTLSLVGVFALVMATLIGTLTYATRWRKDGRRFSTKGHLLIENKAVKSIVRLALVLPILWYGFWILKEILVWRKALDIPLMVSLRNDFLFLSFAVLLLLVFEGFQLRQRADRSET